MTHWFDTFSKKAARFEGIERRSFLAFGTVLGFGAMSGRAEAAAQPPAARPGRTPPNIRPADEPMVVENALGSHTRRTAGALVIHEISTAKAGLSLKSSLAFNRTSQNATISATISRGSDLVAKLDIASTKGGAGTIYINYGHAYSDVQSVTMSTKNGKTFQGTADGRPFTIAGNQVQFLDHGAPPRLITDPGIVSAVRDLDAQSKVLLRVRAPAATAPLKPSAELDRRYVERPRRSPQDTNQCGTHRPVIDPPGDGFYEPGVPEQDCNNCENDCGTNVSSWILDFFSGGTYEPMYYAACMAACYIPGGGCLPVPCGTLQSCASSDTCYDYQGGHLCCPSPGAICAGACCGSTITSCGSDGTCGCDESTSVCGQDCCWPGQACCNGTCCKEKEVCCNGTCCAAGQVCTDGICCKPGVVTCEGLCCDKGQVCHHGKCCKEANFCGSSCCDDLATCLDPQTGVCCGFDQPKCGDICCPLGAICLNGKCCEPNSVCGGICCPSGSTCADPKTHTCTKCPDGKVACLSTNGKGLCCPHDVECCGDSCCAPGQACQGDGKGGFICAAATPIQ
jgi:hypothetical protein